MRRLSPAAVAAARGAVFWLTGVPASGKTTLARGLVAALRAADVAVLWLDSDDLRAVMTPEADYGPADRARFYDTVAHLARRGAEGGVTVVISATAASRAPRDAVRGAVDRFREVWLDCAPAALRGARDIKGLYARADAGQITRLPGHGIPFEPPTADDALRIDTTELGREGTLDRLVEHIGGWSD